MVELIVLWQLELGKSSFCIHYCSRASLQQQLGYRYLQWLKFNLSAPCLEIVPVTARYYRLRNIGVYILLY